MSTEAKATPKQVVTLLNKTSKAINSLISIINKTRNISFTIKGIADDLVQLKPLVSQLVAAVKGNSCDLALGPNAQVVFKNCLQVCQKHAGNIRLAREDQITFLKTQISSFHRHLKVLLQTSQCINTTRQDFMSKDLANPVLQKLESDLSRQITTVKREKDSLTQYRPPASDPEMSQDIWQQRKTYEAIQKVLEEAIRSSSSQRTEQKISNVSAKDKSVCLTGFVNAEQEESRVDQDITEISASASSIAVAGVVRKIDYISLASEIRKVSKVK